AVGLPVSHHSRGRGVAGFGRRSLVLSGRRPSRRGEAPGASRSGGERGRARQGRSVRASALAARPGGARAPAEGGVRLPDPLAPAPDRPRRRHPLRRSRAAHAADDRSSERGARWRRAPRLHGPQRHHVGHPEPSDDPRALRPARPHAVVRGRRRHRRPRDRDRARPLRVPHRRPRRAHARCRRRGAHQDRWRRATRGHGAGRRAVRGARRQNDRSGRGHVDRRQRRGHVALRLPRRRRAGERRQQPGADHAACDGSRRRRRRPRAEAPGRDAHNVWRVVRRDRADRSDPGHGGGAVMALRVVCYVNQFFGQLGGEEKAGVGPHVVDGAVGAARAVQQALGDAGTVVATVICGDNYVAEHADRAVAELVAVVAAARPDLVIAGPAFLAGRYGVACGALCAAVQAQLKIPAVTGMHAENPGVELYRRQVYVVPTGSEATAMLDEVKRLVALGLKLARGEAIGAPVAEGYFARGVTRNVVVEAAAADRAVAMLLDKLAGRPVASEVPRPAFPRVPAPRLIKMLEGATIALVTDGGLVPRGNPDGIEARNATGSGAYSIEGKSGLDPAQYDNPHRGY